MLKNCAKLSQWEGHVGVIPRTPRRPGVMRMTLVSSLLLNIMTCHLVCTYGTLFNVYDPPIETDLITLLTHQTLLK
jgi:hypothetical protein